MPRRGHTGAASGAVVSHLHQRPTIACGQQVLPHCSMLCSGKMITDVTGDCSNLLQLYEHPTLQQKQAVPSVLVQDKPTMEAGKENHHPVPICHAPGSSTQLQLRSLKEFSSLILGLSHCNFVVNVGALPTAPVETLTTSTSTEGGSKNT